MILEEQRRWKYDSMIGKVKSIHKTKKQLLNELKEKGFLVRRHYSIEKIHELANNHQIELTCNKHEVIDGCVGRPNGMLQVLWERGWINKLELEKFIADDKSCQKDENGKMKVKFER